MAKRKKKTINVNNIINSAIEEGISAIMEHHPRFKENQEYILRHIDRKKLSKRVGEIYEKMGAPNEEKLKYLYEEITNYVASGGAFDEAGKEVILKSGLEEKARSGFFKGFFARRKLAGEKYLDNIVTSFQDLYSLLKSGEYAQRMPEVAEAVTTVYDMGFLDPAVDVLKHYGLIDERKYNTLKKSIREKTKEGTEGVVSGIEKYATYQKVAASIFGILGVLILIVSGAGITGNVIGNLSNSTTGIVGGFLILVSLILFFKGKRKKKK